MNLFTIMLFASSISAATIKRWCPSVIPECTAQHYVISGETCQGVADGAHISLDQFFDLNPSIDHPACHYMLAGCNYCVAGPVNTCPSTAPGCKLSAIVEPGDTCWKLLGEPSPGDWNLFAQFRALNPSIDEDCHNLQPNCQYCLPDVPSGPCTGAGETWSAPVYAGQTCWDLLGGYGDFERLDRFYKLNPMVWPGCTNLQLGEKYCIPPA